MQNILQLDESLREYKCITQMDRLAEKAENFYMPEPSTFVIGT